jgi:hypothetical protein
MAAALMLASCGNSGGEPVSATKTFFDEVKAGHAEAAYRSSAFAFQAQQSQKFFETTLSELGLSQIKSAEFKPAEFEDGGRTAKVRATFTNATDAEIPLVITLNQENGAWKVFAIKSPRDAKTGVTEDHFSLLGRGPSFEEPVDRQQAPDAEATERLVADTMRTFGEAVKSGSFREFFDGCSLAWQDQLVTGQVAAGVPSTMRRALTEGQKKIGASRLDTAFAPFIEQKIDLSAIEHLKPVLDHPAQVTTDGLLVISGYYPTEPYRTMFSMKFMYELPRWRLFGLDVSLRQ